MKAIAGNLHFVPRLTHLLLRRNHTTLDGVQAVAAALYAVPLLQHVSLGCYPSTSTDHHGTVDVLTSLSRLQWLTQLDLCDYARLDAAACVALARLTVCHLRRLQWLSFMEQPHEPCYANNRATAETGWLPCRDAVSPATSSNSLTGRCACDGVRVQPRLRGICLRLDDLQQ
jgi:hypothetical protein